MRRSQHVSVLGSGTWPWRFSCRWWTRQWLVFAGIWYVVLITDESHPQQDLRPDCISHCAAISACARSAHWQASRRIEENRFVQGALVLSKAALVLYQGMAASHLRPKPVRNMAVGTGANKLFRSDTPW